MAARALTSGMATAIVAGTQRPIILWEGHFDDGSGNDEAIRLWTGVGDKSWDGHTWTGGGQLLGISPVSESAGVKAQGFDVTIASLPANVALALANCRKNKAGKLYLGLLDSSGAIIADPYLVKQGLFDVATIDDQGDTATVTLRYEDRLARLQTPRERRYTPESQALRDPTDKGFDYVASLVDAQFLLP